MKTAGLYCFLLTLSLPVSFPVLFSGVLSRDVIVKKYVFHEKRTRVHGHCPVQIHELVFPPAVQSLKEQKSAFSCCSSASTACYVSAWCHQRPTTLTCLIFHSLLASFPEENESEKIYYQCLKCKESASNVAVPCRD